MIFIALALFATGTSNYPLRMQFTDDREEEVEGVGVGEHLPCPEVAVVGEDHRKTTTDTTHSS